MRWQFLFPSAFLLFVGIACLVAGCARGPVYYEVSGTVHYDGKPLPAGVIYFNPDVTRGNDGPQGYAIIDKGKYSTAFEGGLGVLGGPYVARIEGFDGQPGHELPLGKPIFTDFQKPIDLPKANSTQNFDIPASKKTK